MTANAISFHDLLIGRRCETSTITRIMRGERRPSINLAARIEAATGGQVSIKDFADEVASAKAILDGEVT